MVFSVSMETFADLPLEELLIIMTLFYLFVSVVARVYPLFSSIIKAIFSQLKKLIGLNHEFWQSYFVRFLPMCIFAGIIVSASSSLTYNEAAKTKEIAGITATASLGASVSISTGASVGTGVMGQTINGEIEKIYDEPELFSHGDIVTIREGAVSGGEDERRIGRPTPEYLLAPYRHIVYRVCIERGEAHLGRQEGGYNTWISFAFLDRIE